MDPQTSQDLAGAARDLGSQPDVDATMDAAVRLIIDTIKGCDAAGITVVTRGRPSTSAASHEIVRRGDALQYELGEGPCLQAIAEHTTIRSADLRTERRWPRWAPQVASRLEVLSMMSFQLFTTADTLGALNLYGRSAHAFGDDDQTEGYVLAGQIAAALVAARQEQSMRSAIASRTVIGQAQGILMERLGIDADAAFIFLRRISQDTNVKLVDLASDLVGSRQIPGIAETDVPVPPPTARADT